MPRQNQEPDPEGPQVAPGAGSETPGSTPRGAANSDGAAAGGAPSGSAVGAVLDWQALLEALAAGGFLAGKPEDQDAVLAEERDAAANGRMGAPLPPWRLAALAVEHMPPGPAQAGWLQAGTASAGRLNEHELAGMAMASRQLTSWAQAAELAAVAQITARAAAADSKIGLEADGRPARLCRDALMQVSLALTLHGYRAGSWADLAVTLTWRLPDTGAALAAGRIDVDRAEAIASATAVLSEDAARAVEAKVLPARATRPPRT